MTAFLFPGQGAQRPGFLHALPVDQAVSETLLEANEVLAIDCLTLDTEEGLHSTVNVQLALLIAGVAATRALIRNEIIPSAVAGMSIGSFAAAVTADAIDFKDALKLVKIRAQLMEDAYPVGYGMAAIGGLRQARIEQLVNKVQTAEHPIYLANYNAPAEFVATGSTVALDRLIELAQKDGARRANRLLVAVPSHCPLLDSVAQVLTVEINNYHIRTPKITYVGNRTARVLTTPDAVMSELATNVSHSVLWYDATTLLYELGERVFIEATPGNTLTRLLYDTVPDIEAKCMDENSVSKLIYLKENRHW